jgi:hypothetical protein
VLGEGAAYRVLADLTSKRITRAALRVADRLSTAEELAREAPARPAPDPEAGAADPLPLRAAAELQSLTAEMSTVSETK